MDVPKKGNIISPGTSAIENFPPKVLQNIGDFLSNKDLKTFSNQCRFLRLQYTPNLDERYIQTFYSSDDGEFKERNVPTKKKVQKMIFSNVGKHDWIVPNGVFSIDIYLVGGGGGGVCGQCPIDQLMETEVFSNMYKYFMVHGFRGQNGGSSKFILPVDAGHTLYSATGGSTGTVNIGMYVCPKGGLGGHGTSDIRSGYPTTTIQAHNGLDGKPTVPLQLDALEFYDGGLPGNNGIVDFGNQDGRPFGTGGNGQYGASGGGGGYTYISNHSVMPGEKYTIEVGTGGKGAGYGKVTAPMMHGVQGIVIIEY